MKRKILTIVAGIMVAAVVTLVACSKDGDSNNLSQKKNVTEETVSFNLGDIFDREAMDSIYDEVAYFHGYEIMECTRNEETLLLNDEMYLEYIINKMRKDVGDLDLPMIHKYLGEKYISPDEFLKLYKNTSGETTILTEFMFEDVVDANFDLKVIKDGTDRIVDALFEAFENSETEMAFYTLYKERVGKLVSEISGPNDFFCVYMSAAVCMNSFMTWGEYFYGDTKIKKDNRSTWQKIKDKAKETVNKLKPYVEADLEGAAWGALVGAGYGAIRGGIAGAAAGGVGAAPGAVVGAAAGAVNGSFEGATAGSLAHYHKNHHK